MLDSVLCILRHHNQQSVGQTQHTQPNSLLAVPTTLRIRPCSQRKITTSKKPETPGVSGGPNGPILGGAGQAEDIALLTRQINVLTHNQKQIEAHMDRFTAQYHVSSGGLMCFTSCGNDAR